MANKSEDILNSLNEAMAIHAKNAVEGLQFDRTELAEIVNITNRDKGEYQVFNGSTRYFAYSENTSYTLGTKVYVTVPNNDYTQQKTIKGKYKAEGDNKAITWVPPLSQYKPFTDNLIEDTTDFPESTEDEVTINSITSDGTPVQLKVDRSYRDGSTGLLANCDKSNGEYSIESDEKTQYANQYVVVYSSGPLTAENKYNQHYQYMGLRAEFKTGLSQYLPISGSYGLLVVIDYSQKLSGEESWIDATKVCKLDTTTMIGNPYNFDTFYEQEALFKLKNDRESTILIKKINVIFYQDGQFRDYSNKLITYISNENRLEGFNESDDLGNIFVRNIGIWFGDELDDEIDDTAEIYSNQDLMYDTAQENESINEKRINLKWMHKNPEQELNDETGALEWIWQLMGTQNLSRVPSNADITLRAHIHWYTNAFASVVEYRETQAIAADHDSEIYRITEKWKYAPTQVTSDEVDKLVKYLNFKEDRDYRYDYVENYEYIDGEETKTYSGYLLTIGADGEKKLNRKVTRKVTALDASSANDKLAGEGWVELPVDETRDKFEIIYQPDIKLSECSVKCIIEYGPEIEDSETGEKKLNTESEYYTIVESNVLTFKNRSWVADPSTLDTANGVSITINDSSGGNYPIYNAVDGKILARKELEVERVLKADILGSYTKSSLLRGGELILWQIPKTNTMINIAGTLTYGQGEVLKKPEEESSSTSWYITGETELLERIADYVQNLSLEELEDVKAGDEAYANFNLTTLKEGITEKISELVDGEDKIIVDSATDFHTAYGNYLEALKNTEIDEEGYQSVQNKYNQVTNDFIKDLLSNLINGLFSYIEELFNNLNDEDSTEKAFLNAYLKKLTDLFYEEKESTSEEIDEEVLGAEKSLKMPSEEVLNEIIDTSIKQYDLGQWFDLNSFDYDNYYYIVRFDNYAIGVDPYQIYYLNETYVKSATNNTITCYIVHDNQVYNGHINLFFSQHGTSGTDYTFSLGLGPLVVLPGDIDTITEQNKNLDEENQISLDDIVYADHTYVDKTSADWVEIGPAAPALTIGETGFRRIQFELYDANNEKIDLTSEQKHAIIKAWVDGTGFYSGKENAKNLDFLIKMNGDKYTDIAIRTNSGLIENLRYIVLAASIRSDASVIFEDDTYELGKINFTQLLPIHIRTEDNYYLEGSDYITYDDGGANPQFFNSRYNLINYDGESLDFSIVSNEEKSEWLPKLDDNNQLQPSPIYISGLNKEIAIEATESGSGETQILYTAPLVIIQNKYQIPALNSWNGELLLDEDSNRVMAATIAAGKKDNNNTFTGVIMGAVSQEKPDDNNKITTTTGLYGYEKGEQSFGFLSTGKGFIGKSGTGRIEFDGNKGYIQSANYSATEELDNTYSNAREGTKIDLDDGSIDIWGQGYSYTYNKETEKWEKVRDNNLSTNIHLDTVGSISKPYFKIAVPRYYTTYGTNEGGTETIINSEKTSSMQSLIQIDNNDFYLQTADYDKDLNTGLRIDLKKGLLDSRGQLTINGARGSQLLFGTEDGDRVKIKLGLTGVASLELVSGQGNKAVQNSAILNLYKYGKQILDFLGLDMKKNTYLIPATDKDTGLNYFTPAETIGKDWPEGTKEYYEALSVLIEDEYAYINTDILAEAVSFYKTFSEEITKSDAKKMDSAIITKTYYDLAEEDGELHFNTISVDEIKEYFSSSDAPSSKVYYLKPYENLYETIDEWDENILYAVGEKVSYENAYYKASVSTGNINKKPGQSTTEAGVQYWVETSPAELLDEEDLEKFESAFDLIAMQNSTKFKEANEKYEEFARRVSTLEAEINELTEQYEEKRNTLNTNLYNYKLDWEEWEEGNFYSENDVVMYKYFLYRSKEDNNDEDVLDTAFWERITPDTEINTTEVPALSDYHETAVENYLYNLLRKYEQQSVIDNAQLQYNTINQGLKQKWESSSTISYTKDKKKKTTYMLYNESNLSTVLIDYYEKLLNEKNDALELLDDLRDRKKAATDTVLNFLNDENNDFENYRTLIYNDEINSYDAQWDFYNNLIKYIYTSENNGNKRYEAGTSLSTQKITVEEETGRVSLSRNNKGNLIYENSTLTEAYTGENNFYEDILFYYEQEEASNYDAINSYVEEKSSAKDALWDGDSEQGIVGVQSLLSDLKTNWPSDWMYFATNSWQRESEDMRLVLGAKNYNDWLNGSGSGDADSYEELLNEKVFSRNGTAYSLICDGENPVTCKNELSETVLTAEETTALLESAYFEANVNKNIMYDRIAIRVDFTDHYQEWYEANQEYIEAVEIQTEYLRCPKYENSSMTHRDFIDMYNYILDYYLNYDESTLVDAYETAYTKYTTSKQNFKKSFWKDGAAHDIKLYNFKEVYEEYLNRENASDEITEGKANLTRITADITTSKAAKTALEKAIGFKKINDETNLKATAASYKVGGSGFKNKTFSKGDIAFLYKSKKTEKNARTGVYVSLQDKNKNKNPLNGGNTAYWQKYSDYIREQYKNYSDESSPWVGFYVLKEGSVLEDEYNQTDTKSEYAYDLIELDNNNFSQTLFDNEKYYELKISDELQDSILNATIELLKVQTQEKAAKIYAESFVGEHYVEVDELKYSEREAETYYTQSVEASTSYDYTTLYSTGDIVQFEDSEGNNKYYVALQENIFDPPIEEIFNYGSLVPVEVSVLQDEDNSYYFRILEESQIDSRIQYVDDADKTITSIISNDNEIFTKIQDYLNEKDVFKVYEPWFDFGDESTSIDTVTSGTIVIEDNFNDLTNISVFQFLDGWNNNDSIDAEKISTLEITLPPEEENIDRITFTAPCTGLFVVAADFEIIDTETDEEDIDSSEDEEEIEIEYQPVWTWDIGGSDFWEPHELGILYEEIPTSTLTSQFGDDLPYWQTNTVYSRNDEVIYNNEVYISSINNNQRNTPSTSENAWKVVTITGLGAEKIYKKVSDLDTLNELDKIILDKIIPTHHQSEEMNTVIRNALNKFVENIDNFASYNAGNQEETIRLSSTDNIRLLIGTKFKVDKNGNITANGGTIGGWTINNTGLSGGSMRINANGSMSGSGWSISAGGLATFSNVNITGGSIGFGGNTWGAGGLNFGSGGIAGGVSYSGSGGYGGSLGSTFKYYDDHVKELTIDVLEVTTWMHATKAQIDDLTSKKITADSIYLKHPTYPNVSVSLQWYIDYFNEELAVLHNAVNR